MDKTRLCKDCGLVIEWIKCRPRCYTCYEVFLQKRVKFKLERDKDEDYSELKTLRLYLVYMVVI